MSRIRHLLSLFVRRTRNNFLSANCTHVEKTGHRVEDATTVGITSPPTKERLLLRIG